MIHILRHKEEDPLFWCSDIHDSHSKDFLLKPRGYKSADEARENLVKLWNNQIGPEATVFHLGDAVLGAGANGLEALKKLLDRLNFSEIYLMPGNHLAGYNSLLKEFYEDGKVISDYYGRVEIPLYQGRKVYFIPNYFEITIGYDLIVMSHYPMAVWRDVNKSSFMLHGHCHNNYIKGKWHSVSAKILDVGIESALDYHGKRATTFSFADIKNIMKRKNVEILDHHKD